MVNTARAPVPVVHLASFQAPPANADGAQPLPPVEVLPAAPLPVFESLGDLETQAVINNPALRRMQQEAAAEWARAGYADKLPDPTFGGMFFGNAMNLVDRKSVV